MRIRNVSALLVVGVVAMLGWLTAVQAQTSPSGGFLSPQALAKLQFTPGPANNASRVVPSEPKNSAPARNRKKMEMLRSLQDLAVRKESLDAVGALLPMQSSLEPDQCAHVQIIPAPNVDAKMMAEIPKGFASNMPLLGGLPACTREVRPVETSRMFFFEGPSNHAQPKPNLIQPLNGVRP